MKVGQWSWAINKREVWQHGYFDTKEQAKEEAVKEIALLKHGIVGYYLGQAQSYIVPEIDADAIVDFLMGDAGDEVGEAADGWFDGLKKVDTDELARALTLTLKGWLLEKDLLPSFCTIENIEYVVL